MNTPQTPLDTVKTALNIAFKESTLFNLVDAQNILQALAKIEIELTKEEEKKK